MTFGEEERCAIRLVEAAGPFENGSEYDIKGSSFQAAHTIMVAGELFERKFPAGCPRLRVDRVWNLECTRRNVSRGAHLRRDGILMGVSSAGEYEWDDRTAGGQSIAECMEMEELEARDADVEVDDDASMGVAADGVATAQGRETPEEGARAKDAAEDWWEMQSTEGASASGRAPVASPPGRGAGAKLARNVPGQRPEGYADGVTSQHFRIAPPSRRGGGGGWAAIKSALQFKCLVNKVMTGSRKGGAIVAGENLPPMRFFVALGIPLWTRLKQGDAWDARKTKLAVTLDVATTGWSNWLKQRRCGGRLRA